MTDEVEDPDPKAAAEIEASAIAPAQDPFSASPAAPDYRIQLDRPAAEERTWAAVAHVAGVASSLLFPIIVSLVIYSVKKDESEFISDQAREALNFQITIALASLVAAISVFCVVGIFLLPLVALFSLVFSLIAAIKANDGERYRYPLCLRLI